MEGAEEQVRAAGGDFAVPVDVAEGVVVGVVTGGKLETEGYAAGQIRGKSRVDGLEAKVAEAAPIQGDDIVAAGASQGLEVPFDVGQFELNAPMAAEHGLIADRREVRPEILVRIVGGGRLGAAAPVAGLVLEIIFQENGLPGARGAPRAGADFEDAAAAGAGAGGGRRKRRDQEQGEKGRAELGCETRRADEGDLRAEFMEKLGWNKIIGQGKRARAGGGPAVRAENPSKRKRWAQTRGDPAGFPQEPAGPSDQSLTRGRLAAAARARLRCGWARGSPPRRASSAGSEKTRSLPVRERRPAGFSLVRSVWSGACALLRGLRLGDGAAGSHRAWPGRRSPAAPLRRRGYGCSR